MSDYQKCENERRIVFGDDFNTRAEINRLFGLAEGAGTMRGGTHLQRDGIDAIIWWPGDRQGDNAWVDVKEDYGENCDAHGHREVLRISERLTSEDETSRHVTSMLNDPAEHTRYVFWHERRKGVAWYKFYGVFKLMIDKTMNDGKCWYERIATEVTLP